MTSRARRATGEQEARRRSRRTRGSVLPAVVVALFRIDDRLVERAKAALHPDERRLLGRVGRARRREWLCARWAIKAAARRWWPKLRLHEILTAMRPSGPPCALAPDGRALQVSAAHDGAFVMAAASSKLVLGVDIQPIDARCLRLARRFHPPAAESPASAAAWWVALEAAAKCTGLPLTRLQREASWRGGRLRTLTWPGGRLRVEIFRCHGRMAALARRPAIQLEPLSGPGRSAKPHHRGLRFPAGSRLHLRRLQQVVHGHRPVR